MLEVRGLTVRYGDTLALDRVDLAVADCEVMCVLGPSGSGKSTLLRAIAGLERPDAGMVLRDGVDLGDTPPHRRELGLMFQDHALFPHRDVLGNVAFGLRMRGLPRDDVETRACQALELVGLAGFERRGVRELSGGEQQRVALARALAPEPELLMLDEPLGALDRSLREELTADLRDLFSRLDIAVLLVTHDHDEAFAIGDRVAIVDNGCVQQVGTPIEVWQHPSSETVARFLGWNVITSSDGARTALRPDALRLDPQGELAGTVVARSFRRDHFRARVSLSQVDDTVDVVVRGAEPPSVGASVRLAIDPLGVVILDR